MNYRIVRIRGRTAADRERRLNAITHWMSGRGWQAVEVSESTEQAMFEPAGDTAEPIRPWQFPPGHWRGLLEEWSQPRRAVLLGGGAVVLITLFAINASRPAYDPQAAQRAEQANWRRVTVDTLNVRESPQSGAQIVGMVFRNQRVMVGDERDGWIELVEPHRGFVATRFLERVVPLDEDGGDDGDPEAE